MPSKFCAFPFILDASLFPPLTNRSPGSWRAWELLEPQIGLLLDANALLHEGGIAKNSFQCPDGSSVVFETNEKVKKEGMLRCPHRIDHRLWAYMNEILRAKETSIFRFEPGSSFVADVRQVDEWHKVQHRIQS